MNSDEGKSALANVIAHTIRVRGATACYLVSTAWLVHRTVPEGMSADDQTIRKLAREVGPISQQPDKHEVVFIQEYTRGNLMMHSAPIIRTKGERPRLGEWQTMEASPNGRFAEAILPALELPEN